MINDFLRVVAANSTRYIDNTIRYRIVISRYLRDNWYSFFFPCALVRDCPPYDLFLTYLASDLDRNNRNRLYSREMVMYVVDFATLVWVDGVVDAWFQSKAIVLIATKRKNKKTGMSFSC